MSPVSSLNAWASAGTRETKGRTRRARQGHFRQIAGQRASFMEDPFWKGDAAPLVQEKARNREQMNNRSKPLAMRPCRGQQGARMAAWLSFGRITRPRCYRHPANGGRTRAGRRTKVANGSQKRGFCGARKLFWRHSRRAMHDIRNRWRAWRTPCLCGRNGLGDRLPGILANNACHVPEGRDFFVHRFFSTEISTGANS